MTLWLALLWGCTSDLQQAALVDEAACAWVVRCSDRHADLAACLDATEPTVEPGCEVDADAADACIEALETVTCPAGGGFEDPAVCDEVWICS